MSCGDKHKSGNCVKDILREIVDAQNDVVHECQSSCEQSINDLLGNMGGGNGLDTVPVILYCKDCKPFVGYGTKRRMNGSLHDLISSFVFRVKEVDDHTNCAVLELLSEDEECLDDICEQEINDLRVTGICITVDLDCFCHITCLPAINALGPSSDD
ncbi:spore coat protein [Pontibacillus halophilus JSM 076056 = DSM 19796]|uniref:Spore coat protein n=1 Tax=Pontibacillus halophilus JSM 076056 = DSM 19796 TaxID=1385510 RepID=A0A0A5IA56_9BACI|nr:CotY/CotZ family spore coat protein [Pontibacillus halophilus]KGX92722.1 spore coat protein [Pontibacillus halophilus JSM 076056 = DSM 19796]